MIDYACRNLLTLENDSLLSHPFVYLLQIFKSLVIVFHDRVVTFFPNSFSIALINSTAPIPGCSYKTLQIVSSETLIIRKPSCIGWLDISRRFLFSDMNVTNNRVCEVTSISLNGCRASSSRRSATGHTMTNISRPNVSCNFIAIFWERSRGFSLGASKSTLPLASKVFTSR